MTNFVELIEMRSILLKAASQNYFNIEQHYKSSGMNIPSNYQGRSPVDGLQLNSFYLGRQYLKIATETLSQESMPELMAFFSQKFFSKEQLQSLPPSDLQGQQFLLIPHEVAVAFTLFRQQFTSFNTMVLEFDTADPQQHFKDLIAHYAQHLTKNYPLGMVDNEIIEGCQQALLAVEEEDSFEVTLESIFSIHDKFTKIVGTGASVTFEHTEGRMRPQHHLNPRLISNFLTESFPDRAMIEFFRDTYEHHEDRVQHHLAQLESQIGSQWPKFWSAPRSSGGASQTEPDPTLTLQ